MSVMVLTLKCDFLKTIKFRPLRLIKKTGKITVSSYQQWRSVKTADYNKFKLVIDESYKMFNDDDFVYSHDGKQLFFYDFDPNQIITNPDIPCSNGYFIIPGTNDKYLKFRNDHPYILLDRGDWKTYWCRGLDVDGVPTFSHYTPDYLATHNFDLTLFEPLTVGIVRRWFGWFLWQLDNSILST